MQWVNDNWVSVAAVSLAAINLFSAIAAITQTKKDDTIAKWLKDVGARFLSIH